MASVLDGRASGWGSAMGNAFAAKVAGLSIGVGPIPNAEGAKAILEQLGTTLQTTYERPGAKQPANQKSNQQKKSK